MDVLNEVGDLIVNLSDLNDVKIRKHKIKVFWLRNFGMTCIRAKSAITPLNSWECCIFKIPIIYQKPIFMKLHSFLLWLSNNFSLIEIAYIQFFFLVYRCSSSFYEKISCEFFSKIFIF